MNRKHGPTFGACSLFVIFWPYRPEKEICALKERCKFKFQIEREVRNEGIIIAVL